MASRSGSGSASPRVSRRAALIAAAAPVVMAIGGCEKRSRGSVVIIGGGLCGLVTLDRLSAAGRDAVLVEAAERLGGRILTVRQGLSTGLRAELGAERVGIEDRGVRALLGGLGITTTPYPEPTQPLALSWNGVEHRFSLGRGLPPELLEGLSDRERAAAPFGIIGALVGSVPPPAADDPRSGIEWLRSIGMTSKGEELVRAFVALPLDAMPAAVFHRAAIRDARAGRSDTVAGGTDRIVAALETKHAAVITKGVSIATIRQDAAGVAAVDAHGRTFAGTHAIVCLPLRPLRALGLDEATRSRLTGRIQALDVGHESKLAVETPVSDARNFSFAQRRVSWSLPERSTRGTLVRQTLLWESDAARPATRAGAAGILAHDFSADPLIGGAYAFARAGTPAPGVVLAGRIVFAGADLSDAPGWMEGAVRAADDAVATIVR